MRAPVIPEHRMLVHRIAENWKEGSAAPYTPDSMRWRGSWAGNCARQVAYKTMGLEETNPPSLADHWRMGLGSVVHELLEPAVQQWIKDSPELTAEEEVDVTFDSEGYGHVDLVLTAADGRKIVLELKTINGFGFKRSVEDHDGPRHSHVLQGALYAKGLDADLLVIGYLAMELISAGRAAGKGIDDVGRFAAEWHFTPDEFLPLAEEEERRLAGITKAVHEQESCDIPRRFSLSDPDIPFPAEVVDPRTGQWELREVDEDGGVRVLNTGRAWQCRYCNHQDRCVADWRADAV